MEGYRDELFANYATSKGQERVNGIPVNSQIKTWRRQFKGVLPADKHSKILEIGCGPGAFLYFLRNEGYQNLEGIDISSEQVLRAKEGNLPAEVADAISYLSDKDGVYDWIACFEVVEHFEKKDVIPFLQSIRRALKNRGILVVSTPNMLSFVGTGMRYTCFTHEVGFTPSSLTQVLRISNFKNINVKPCRPVPKGLKSFARLLCWYVLELLIRICWLIEAGVFRGPSLILTRQMVAIAEK